MVHGSLWFLSINFKVNTLCLIDIFLPWERVTINFITSFEKFLDPCNVVVGYANLWIRGKLWNLLYVWVGKTLHVFTIYNKRKSIVLQVFLHKDNPWIWSKLWRFCFVRIRPSKPRISEYLIIKYYWTLYIDLFWPTKQETNYQFFTKITDV